MRYLIAIPLMMASAMACDEGGSPTGATCPPTQTLTWENFGQDFMETYCVSCHRGFGDVDSVRRQASAIDSAAGAGLRASNDWMPEDGDKPTLEERKLLAEWLSCGAP